MGIATTWADTTSSTAAGSGEECYDIWNLKRCTKKKRQEQCYRRRIAKHCKKTCDSCHEKEACEDRIATNRCEKKKAKGKCDKKRTQKRCQMTCDSAIENLTMTLKLALMTSLC